MGKKLSPTDLGAIAIEGKRIVFGSASVTGSANVDLSSKLSSIDYVVLGKGDDLTATDMWVSYAVSGTTLTLKCWKPTAADGSAANVTPTAATTAATISYIAIGDPAS